MLIDDLRAGTQQAHQQLDHALYPFIQAIKTPEDYARLLNVFYGMFKPVYQELDKYLNDNLVPGYTIRRKPEWILQDLEMMGLEAREIEWYGDIPAITNIPTAFGACYVREGSTMGRAIISKKIKENLQWNDEAAIHFFNGYGENNKSIWSNFLTAMELVPDNNLHSGQLIKTAQDTFVKFHHWINKYYS